MLRTVERLLLFLAMSAVLMLAMMALKPWTHGEEQFYRLIVAQAEDVAIAIEAGSKFRLPFDAVLLQRSVRAELVIPGQDIVVDLPVSELLVKVPPVGPPFSVVRGTHPGKPLIPYRQVAVYINGTNMVIRPLPYYSYRRQAVDGATEHIIVIRSIVMRGDPARGNVMRVVDIPSETFVRPYLGPSATALLMADGREILSFEIKPGDIILLIVEREIWYGAPGQ